MASISATSRDQRGRFVPASTEEAGSGGRPWWCSLCGRGCQFMLRVCGFLERQARSSISTTKPLSQHQVDTAQH